MKSGFWFVQSDVSVSASRWRCLQHKRTLIFEPAWTLIFELWTCGLVFRLPLTAY